MNTDIVIKNPPKPHVPKNEVMVVDDNVAPRVVMEEGIEILPDSKNGVCDPEKKYGKKERLARVGSQYKKLVGKINYMNKLTNIGRKFRRNAPCPCKSGKKFKNCCITIHEHNCKKVSQLQVAMDKLHSRIYGYGWVIGRTGVRE